MNTTHPLVLIVPLFVGLLIPTGVLVWYMRWRQQERREADRQVETLVAALSRSEAMVDRLKSDREDEIPVVYQQSCSLPDRDPMITTRQHHVTLQTPSHPVMPYGESGRETSPGSIEKAKVLLKGGIPPVEVAKTLNIGLGEVEMLHRMIAMMEQRGSVHVS
jgi:hypothetical protein